MSKNLVWAVGIVIVLGLVYWGVSSVPSREAGENNPKADTKSEGKKMAFADFVKTGGAYKCIINQSVAGSETTGITYISNGMIRGEYSSKTQGINVDTSFIARDGFTYTWTSMMPNSGFKTKIVAPTEGNSSAPMSASYGFNANQIGDYNCEPWTVEASKFTIPASVTFQSL